MYHLASPSENQICPLLIVQVLPQEELEAIHALGELRGRKTGFFLRHDCYGKHGAAGRERKELPRCSRRLFQSDSES